MFKKNMSFLKEIEKDTSINSRSEQKPVISGKSNFDIKSDKEEYENFDEFRNDN
jgi:hypothetical protein